VRTARRRGQGGLGRFARFAAASLAALVAVAGVAGGPGAGIAAGAGAAGNRALGVGRSGLPSGRTTYRTPTELQADLDKLADGHPGLVRRVVLPRKSVDGRALTGVEIAQDVNRDDDGRPVYLVFGLTHAREWPSAEVATEFALDLVAHQTEPRVAALLAGLRIVVVPVVNPDGYAYSRGTDPLGQTDAAAAVKRRDCRALPGDAGGTDCAGHRGVDLNRNFGAYWGGPGASTSLDSDTYRGTGPWSEPEAAAVHEFTQGLPVTGVESLHNVAGLILRPPGFQRLGRARDEARLKSLGDAMAAATGYESRYGYELYEVTGALEDWNYVAQGAFGYTIELGGAYAGDTSFQGTYATHVVDQYLGRAGSPSAGKGMREALLLAAEEAMDARDHVVLRGPAPAGARLTLRKRFDTPTSPVCSDTLTADACGPVAPAFSTPDGLALALAAPVGGTFRWQVGPSTRPFVRKAGHRETWTLTCRRPGRATVTKAVFADRGQAVQVAPCDPASLPLAGVTSVGLVSLSSSADTGATVRRSGRIRVRVRCPVRCTVTVRVTRGSSVVARRTSIRVAAGRTVTLALALTAAGRRLAAVRTTPPALTATARFTGATGSTATLTQAFALRR
jgi:hypothetical protein